MGVGAASSAELCILHLYLEELYESFVEVDRQRVGELTAARVITGRFNGAFCNFLCTKKKKCSKMTGMNVFLFMYMEMKRYRSVSRDECAGYDGNVVFGGLLCLYFVFFV